MNTTSHTAAQVVGQDEKSVTQSVSNPAKNVEDDRRYLARQEQDGRLVSKLFVNFNPHTKTFIMTPQLRNASPKSLITAVLPSELLDRAFVGVTYISIMA
jgi:hypothetical protein